MDLSETDWGILEVCSENRETRSNLSVLVDVTPNYVSKELSKLTEIELVEEVGPAERSGMYITTAKGDFVLGKREKYEKQHSELFGALVTSSIEIADELNEQVDDREIGPNDIVLTSVDAYDQLCSLSDMTSITPQKAKDVSQYDNIYAVYGVLYELYFHDLLSRTSNKGEYKITERGRELLNNTTPAATTPENINRIWNTLPEKRE
ncbi:hypothetical protein SAMN04488066_11568 [Halorubrum aquaticum]|uniref:Uncharacterized protein n=1 Tax=Halorubrum aquaticum TaxID=387340 RepID=A0A1I3BV85_9EURY|nr:phage repressor protein [Halorubrum aquaticum]SFH65889.1 hypothetical protein SAMN04488066_11568 [Halorubrum aquaticum]